MDINNRRGYLYTIAIILLLLPLILLLLFYMSTQQTTITETIAKIRCDELHYFVEDVKRDMERAVVIFGRRAAIYAIDYIVINGTGLYNYTYQQCDDFMFDGNSSEAAFAELINCGTLHGENSTYMVNHTIREWLEKMNDKGSERHFRLNITLNNLTIIPRDAWNFAIIMVLDLRMYDEAEMCHYLTRNVTTESITTIKGLEDPSFPLNTGGLLTKKYISDCDEPGILLGIAGCSKSDEGEGVGQGRILLYSEAGGTPGDLEDYCNDHTASELLDTVLVMDKAFGGPSCNGYEWCYDVTSSKHWGALIDYGPADPSSLISKCNVTIPWISDTGEMDNQSPWGGGERAEGCDEEYIFNQTCVLVRNYPACNAYEVIVSQSVDSFTNYCYYISNVTYYSNNCTNNILNGPSFFDRLDGRLNLSQTYSDQALDYYGVEQIGLETFVDPYTFGNASIPFNTTYTWVDYLYWGNTTGCPALGVCQNSQYELMLDCPHSFRYEIATECATGDTFPPTVDILTPLNESSHTCVPIEITGTADDCDGELDSVWVTINSDEYEANLTMGNWTYDWDPTPYGDGNHTICAYSVDEYGVESELDCIIVEVSGC